jgi:nitrous oxidase accessory protein NosD
LVGPFGNAGGSDPTDAAIGPFGGTVNGVVRNNHVIAAGSSFGIVVQGEGIRDSVTLAPASGATITGNVIDGARTGLNLREGAATFFGANISQNDFVNSVSRGVSATGAYTASTELSVAGVGNYWGHAAAPGFLPSDSNNPLIADRNPFCEPVAGHADPLPLTCP